MRLAGLLVLTLAASCVAVDAAEDEEASETEQAVWDGSGWDPEGETILVQGGLDSCWAGLCWPSSWPTDPGPGYTGDGGHGGGGVGHGGGDAGKPDPTPAPRDCTAEPTLEQCLDCCEWNVDKVWGERCRRLPNRTKKQRKETALCWETAERLRGDCQRACPRLSIVVAQ